MTDKALTPNSLNGSQSSEAKRQPAMNRYENLDAITDPLNQRIAELEAEVKRLRADMQLAIEAGGPPDERTDAEECRLNMIWVLEQSLNPKDSPTKPHYGWVEDGFGSSWARCKPDCGLEVVRPGNVQCACDYLPTKEANRG